LFWQGCWSARSVALMASDEKESALYTKVKDWTTSAEGLRCEEAWINTGPREAIVDVVGLRHAGGDLRGDFELITIEVKKSSARFLTSAGQAAAYGVFADRSYLCCPRGDKPFDEDNIDIASHLGIGLIEIDEYGEVSKVLAAPSRRPIPRKRHEFLDSLGLVVCQLCGVPFRTSANPEYKNRRGETALVDGDYKEISKSVRERKGFVWPIWEPEGRRFLCSDCTYYLFYEFDKEAT